MDPEIKKELEEATRVAFARYSRRHPSLAGYLDSHCSEIISSTVESIEDDPMVAEAFNDAKTEERWQKIVEVAAEYLPKVIGIL